MSVTSDTCQLEGANRKKKRMCSFEWTVQVVSLSNKLWKLNDNYNFFSKTIKSSESMSKFVLAIKEYVKGLHVKYLNSLWKSCNEAITTQQATIPLAESGPNGKIPPAPGTNQIAGFVEFSLLTHWEKINRQFLESLNVCKQMYYTLGRNRWEISGKLDVNFRLRGT